MLMMLHKNGVYSFGDGDRCSWLYIGILAYLIPSSHWEKHANESGLLET